VARRKGFILLTGEVGAGKTTLLRSAIQRLPADLLDAPQVALIASTTDLTPLDLLKMVCAEFGLAGGSPRALSAASTMADYLIALKEFLIDRLRGGLTTVLIIDEAQNLAPVVLEQVRLLSNLETNSDKLLPIILTGQTELRAALAQPDLRQLRQRIAVEYHVEPLRRDEVLPYLEHRIAVAGGRYERIFPSGVESIFADFSQGCPRLVNLLADSVLLAAYAKSVRPIPPALIEQKAKEIAVRNHPRFGSPERGA